MLLDTSGLFDYFDADDPQHDLAATFIEEAVVLLTHSVVLAEFVALCTARRQSRPATLAFVADILVSPLVEGVWVERPLSLAALSLLNARPDKSYTWCDAISFVLMERHGLTEALTSDHHFTQAGFHRLLG
jgi:predicted nucleic acid-binding protein